MSTPVIPEATFPVLHSAFYSAFDPWHKANKGYSYKGGVYKVIASSPISRVLGIDQEGILYIGKGNMLSGNNRIGKLINAFNQTEAKHEAGVRYNKLNYHLKFPISEIRLLITLVEHPAKTEAELLNEYLTRFGELPPLNRQGGVQS
jgi:hypothetical protein